MSSYKIISKEALAKDVFKITITAAQIAKKAQAGQFVVVIIDEKGERIPLTLADWNKEKGRVTLIFQKVGFTTERLALLNQGDEIMHLLGPLGHATEVKKLGTVVCIGGGVGIAEIYPVSRALKAAGNRVISIIGARTKELLILEKEMKETSDELFIATDDGSYGRKGFVTDILKGLLSTIENSTHAQYPGLVYCIGPVLMMKVVAKVTRSYQIKTIASLNPIMVDATGMCGSCRCTVAGKTVFGCVDGPDFDAHEVNFDELIKRLNLFKSQESLLKN